MTEKKEKKIEKEAISEKDGIPSIAIDAAEDKESTDLDPLSLKEYLFPKERPWVWKSFAAMFVVFFGYYFIKYKNIIS